MACTTNVEKINPIGPTVWEKRPGKDGQKRQKNRKKSKSHHDGLWKKCKCHIYINDQGPLKRPEKISPGCRCCWWDFVIFSGEIFRVMCHVRGGPSGPCDPPRGDLVALRATRSPLVLIPTVSRSTAVTTSGLRFFENDKKIGVTILG